MLIAPIRTRHRARVHPVISDPIRYKDTSKCNLPVRPPHGQNIAAQKAWPRLTINPLTAVRQLPRMNSQQGLSSHSPRRIKVPLPLL
jgi:hypothetical protein